MHFGIAILVLSTSFILPRTGMAATASGVQDVSILGAKDAHYEVAREPRVATADFHIRDSRGETAIAAGTRLAMTRLILTKQGDYAYVVVEGGRPYGMVKKSTLDAVSRARTATEGPADLFQGLGARLLSQASLRRNTGLVESNAGFHRVSSGVNGIAVTVDMCPRPDDMENEFFKGLAAFAKERGSPIPVTLFMSGQWLERRHATRRAEIERLRKLDGAELLFDFANHSATHPYDKGRPVHNNFLLMKPDALGTEVLDAERAMLRHGFVPAPAFRFPGLISTRAMREKLADHFSLGVYGAGSWPGLGQVIQSDDVVLVHGNGGEPGGIHKLMKWLDTQRARIRSGDFTFFDFTATPDLVPSPARGKKGI